MYNIHTSGYCIYTIILYMYTFYSIRTFLGESVEGMDNQPVDTKKNQIQNR